MPEVRCSSAGHACRRLPSLKGHGGPVREWVFICWGSSSRLRSWQSTGSSPDAILGGAALSAPRCSCPAPGAAEMSSNRDPRLRPPRSRAPGPARDQARPRRPGRGAGEAAAPPKQRSSAGPRGPLSAPRGKDAAEKGKGGNRSVPEAQGPGWPHGRGWPRMARPGLTGADGASTVGRAREGGASAQALYGTRSWQGRVALRPRTQGPRHPRGGAEARPPPR